MNCKFCNDKLIDGHYCYLVRGENGNSVYVSGNSQSDNSGNKFDSGKPRMDLLPMDALLEVAKVLTFGSAKYGDRNWEKGIDVQRLRAAQLRHDASVEMGQLIDEESGLLHTAHKATDALMELSMRLRNEK
jgi:hypothetical protein